MPVIPVNVFVKIFMLDVVLAAKVGLTVDKPLPDRIERDSIGTIDIVLYREFSTTVNVNLTGKGMHYIILGLDYGGYVLPTTASYLLRLQLLGQTAEITKTNTPSYAKRYLAVIVEVDDRGMVTFRNQSEVEPGQEPIITRNSGSFFGGDPSAVMADIMVSLMQVMLPIMVFSMMINMVNSLMTSMAGMIQ